MEERPQETIDTLVRFSASPERWRLAATTPLVVVVDCHRRVLSVLFAAAAADAAGLGPHDGLWSAISFVSGRLSMFFVSASHNGLRRWTNCTAARWR
jgi:hypothetical protein